MNRDAVVATIIEHFSSLFPMPCPSCARRFETYDDFLEAMKPLGVPISYDAELGGWAEDEFLGTAVLFNCECKTTLSLGFDTMDRDLYRQILQWMQAEVATSEKSLQEVLRQLQDDIGAGRTN